MLACSVELVHARTCARVDTLDFLDFHDLGTFVVPTARADPVWMFGLVAVRALRERLLGERVVSASLASPALGVTPFRISHFQ